MNSAIKYIVSLLFLSSFSLFASTEDILRDSVIKNGFLSVEEVNPETDYELVALGKVFFNSEKMSLNSDTSCQTCHLDKFGSADGIPNAVGVGGEGEGSQRMINGGAILPRNTLPLWGRGSDFFTTLFWDGRVQKTNEFTYSQFGELNPSEDPLVIAAHLPAIEIREMLVEDKFVTGQKQETFESANQIFGAITDKLRVEEQDAILRLAKYNQITTDNLSFLHIAEAVAEFIRRKFSVQQTVFHEFVFNQGKLNKDQIEGAMIFYGKGKCSVCHSGPLLSDMKFHSIAFPQLGYGRNGFGIDYGRYNATHNPKDLYKFRTPPLLDVENTFPYSHSGAIDGLFSAIIFHFDPLRYLDQESMSILDRSEYYKKISMASNPEITSPALSDEEVLQLIEFLKTLSFTPKDI